MVGSDAASSSNDISFSISFYSSEVQLAFSLCYRWNLLKTFSMISGVKTASGRVKAASCHAMTILVISLPENPAVSAAIFSISFDSLREEHDSSLVLVWQVEAHDLIYTIMDGFI